jgi:DNA repair exonuclease SbcCD ATPase subunit
MDTVPLIFSGVSAISLVIISVLALQIQKIINANKSEQEKVLKLVEADNELSKQLGEITAEGNRKQIESYEIVHNRVENLIQVTSNLENCLNQLLESNNLSGESLTNLLQGNTDKQLENIQGLIAKIDTIKPIGTQVENLVASTSNLENRITEAVANLMQENAQKHLDKLQALVEKFETFVPVKNQVDSLVEGTAKLENRLVQLLEAQNASKDNLTALTQGHTEMQLEKLQALVDKFQELAPVKNQVESLVKGTSNLEDSLTQLQESQKTSQQKTEKQLEGLQVLVDKFQELAPVKNQVESLVKGTSNLEDSLTQLQESQKTSQQKTEKQLEGLQVLVDKFQELAPVKNQVETLITGTLSIEKHLNQLVEAHNTFQENLNSLMQDNTNTKLAARLDKLQELVEKLNGFETVKTQIDDLPQETSNLESPQANLSQANKPGETNKPRARTPKKSS